MDKEPQISASISRASLGGARIAEIKSIVKKLEESEHGRRAYQTLPRHMQRRQCSINPKRLPSYIREQHRREGGSAAKVTRRPSRKYRRRPRNLLKEYNRRQKTHVWLETHIWHAKRFHMIRRWGYNLPDCPTFKGYRASLKAAKHSCLVQDVSYLCCIELEGKTSALLSGLSRITQPSDFTSLTLSRIQEGKEWAVITIFEPEKYPLGAVGDVDIQWLPSDKYATEIVPTTSRLWIWIHPSAHNHVVDILTNVFELNKIKNVDDCDIHLEVNSQAHSEKSDARRNTNESLSNVVVDGASDLGVKNFEKDITASEETCVEIKVGNKKRKSESQNSDSSKKRPKNVNAAKLATRNIPFERTPKYCCDSSGVKITLLKDTLCRFRFTGPRSIDVLKAAFIPASLESIKCIGEGQSSEDENANTPWWKDYYYDEKELNDHQSQVNTWTNLTSVHPEKPFVLPITIRDPRVTLPGKKSPIPSQKGAKKKINSSNCVVRSPLFHSEIRDKIALSKEPDCKINEHRSQLLVPGSTLPETSQEAKLPLLLLSRPCTHTSGYGNGWDVIVSSGWGMSTWLPIVLSGGVAGGQQAAENLHMELLSPMTPNLLPDTPAGDYYSKVLSEERRKEFFKRPPSCRLNFIKLGVQYPFNPPWLKLVQDWVPGTQDICVIRNPVHISSLASICGDAFSAIKRDNLISPQKVNTMVEAIPVQTMDLITSPANIAALLESKEQLENTTAYDSEEELLASKGFLVKVKVILEGRGNLEPSAMICLPLRTDIEERYKESLSLKDTGNISEPDHIDTQQEQRKLLKAEHEQVKRKMYRLNKKARLRVDKTLAEGGTGQTGVSVKSQYQDALSTVKKENQDVCAKHLSYNQNMENLWLMKSDGPLQCCSRKIMGYLTHGCFSMTLGRGAGIGWIALKPLLDCIQFYEKMKDNAACSNPAKLENKNVKNVQRISILVRNPSSLQYHWGTLCVFK